MNKLEADSSQEPLWGNGGAVGAVAITPDGRLIISGGDDDGTVRVWDRNTGQQLASLTGHTGALWAVTVTPDGRQIVSGGADGTVRLWDRDSGQEQAKLTGHTGWVWTVAVTPDSASVVSGGEDGTVKLWDRETGREQATLTGHHGLIWTLAITPDGLHIASGGADETVRIWDRNTGRLEATLSGVGAVWAVAITPDGQQIISGGEDGTVRLWDRHSVSRGQGKLSGRTRLVWAMAVSPDTRFIASGGADGIVRLWDSESGQEQAALIAHTGAVRAVAITPNGRLIASGGADGLVRVWNCESGQEQAALIAHTGAVRAVAITPDGRHVVSSGEDGRIRLWDCRDASKEKRMLTGHTRLVWALAITPDSRQIVSGSSDGIVRVWDSTSGQEQVMFAGHTGAVRAVAITPDGRQIVTGGADETVRVWDRDSGQQQASYLHHSGLIWAVAASPDATEIVSASIDGTIRVWSRRSRSQVRRMAAALAEPRGTLAGVQSDDPSSIDLLNIGEDVEVLATLIAASATEPPLSIALLGKWGAGKSTAMKHVRERVEQLAALSGKSARRSAYTSTIRQISFNAWHYSDDHVWSGLVEHLFRELAGVDIPSKNESAWANKERDQLRARVKHLESLGARLDQSLNTLDTVVNQQNHLGEIRFPLRLVMSGTIVAQGIAKEVWYSRRFWLMAWIIVIIGLVLWAALTPKAYIAYKSVAGALALSAPIVIMISEFTRKIATYTDSERQRLSRRSDDMHRRLAETLARLAEVDAATRLANFVGQQADGSSYDPYRGLVGQVNRDLDTLHRALAAAHAEWQISGASDPPPLERIVLYIDDLDRCPPRRVVEVLTAINLLLAKPLFVVVVAVDPEWLRRCLTIYHGILLNTDGEGTSGEPSLWPDSTDWLDKIFQIPYALRPMSTNAESYISALLPPCPDPIQHASNVAMGSEPLGRLVEDNALTDAVATPPEYRLVYSQEIGEPDVGRNEAHPMGRDSVTDRSTEALQPAKLILTEQERKVIPLFGSLLPTPRAAKKFINLYRLIRISVQDRDLEDFVGSDDGGAYQVVLLLLVTVIASPLLAKPMFDTINNSAGNGDITELLRRNPCGQQFQPFCDELADMVCAIRDQGTPFHGLISTYQSWLPRISRHSFHVYYGD